MRPMELRDLGRSVFRYGWRTSLARAIGMSRRMIAYYETGEKPIPAQRASTIRAVADIGPSGSIIRAAVRAAEPDLRPFLSHKIAVQVMKDLVAAGIVQVESKGSI
jgi:DNA-binding transcriptional regulator YdaS (Cro superfamily)